MGRIGTEEETKLVASCLNEMHISEAKSAIVAFARSKGTPETVVLIFESCCGYTAYSVPIEMAEDMITGLQGALAHRKKMMKERSHVN